MDEEEKKAIKGLEWSQQQMRLGNLPDYDQGHYADIRIVLNFIEKQSKEIEELKVINQMQKYRIEGMDERELISRNEVENIITSEIKEIEKFKAENDAKTTNYHLYRIFVDEVLQSILDKIKGDDK